MLICISIAILYIFRDNNQNEIDCILKDQKGNYVMVPNSESFLFLPMEQMCPDER